MKKATLYAIICSLLLASFAHAQMVETATEKIMSNRVSGTVYLIRPSDQLSPLN